MNQNQTGVSVTIDYGDLIDQVSNFETQQVKRKREREREQIFILKKIKLKNNNNNNNNNNTNANTMDYE